jgi:alpha-glucuronidase
MKQLICQAVLARLVLLFGLLPWVGSVHAETGADGWLRYAPVASGWDRWRYEALPGFVVALDRSDVVFAAQEELVRGVRGLLGRILREETSTATADSIVLATLDTARKAFPELGKAPELKSEGFWITSIRKNGKKHLLVTGPDDRGVLHGVFALLRRMQAGESIARLNLSESPAAPIRILNHWDNLDGTIERGYAGRSLFWESGKIVSDLGRVRDYARLMASVGINGCSINNVNADARVVTEAYLPEVARVAEVFRNWGVKLYLSLDFASPQKIGGIDSFDPLDPRTVEFWQKTVDEVYRAIPDLGGFVLKADSEGRLGPSQYGRTHADAANVIARALKPHGGVLFYRGFVYDHEMDWHDLSLDRAKAAYDNFKKLDGRFEDNVVVQIKHGPIDFQVREPASPLFGALEKTSQAVELQITQEYTGQQRHLCYLVPMWKETLDFDMEAKGRGTPVKDLVSGKTFNRPSGGYVGVSNVGRDVDWLGSHLALANLYGFGRLAWNPDLSAKDIAEEWTRQTFGNDSQVVDAITDLQMRSWPAYENYTGPLGIGTLTDIIHVHFGPGVESSEHNGWGQWHRSNETGTGMDRTVATGTGYLGQYRPAVAARFESIKTCPEELLLFMHHVAYTHELRSGKTVIQRFYDAHYAGAEEAARFVTDWKKLKGKIDDERYAAVLKAFEFQAGHACVWRDAVNDWFFKKSGISDKKGRVDHHPGRIEAESMVLDGYSAITVTPWETASGGRAIAATATNTPAAASFQFFGKPGWHDVVVQYFDENAGASRFTLLIGGQVMDRWTADDTLPSDAPNGHTSSRHTVHGVMLRRGDEIRLQGVPDGKEAAVVDYVEIKAAD